MGITKLFETVLVLIVLGLVLTFIANTVILFSVKSDIIRWEQVIITYAQNNGGFTSVDGQSFSDFANQAATHLNLDGKIKNIQFSHPINLKVQKGTEIYVEVTPSFPLTFAFIDQPLQVDGNPVKRTGITRNYYKDLS